MYFIRPVLYQKYFRKYFCLRYTYSDSVITCVKSETVKLWNVVFFGTDGLSEVTLEALNLNRLSSNSSKVVRSLEVVCIKSDCPVRRYAAQNSLTLHTWPYDIPADVYDVGIVVSFGHLIPSQSIFSCKYGMINAHPSLLPRWRGAAPIFHTILNGDTETGVTITQVSPNKFDVGNIIMQECYTVPPNCSSKILINDLSKLASKMVLKTLEKLPHYLESSYSQPKEGVMYARKIKTENCRINWIQDTALNIDRKYRAFNGFFGLYTFWKDMKIEVLSLSSISSTEDSKVSSLVPGDVTAGFCYFHKKRKVLYVKCKDGWTGITAVRIAKRGKITALDFYNGFLSKEDARNCYLN